METHVDAVVAHEDIADVVTKHWVVYVVPALVGDDLVLTAFGNGHQLVMTALGGSGAIFLGLSAYALTSRRDFSFMGGFLFAGVMVAFLAGLAAVFLQMPALSLAVSAMFVLLMSASILYQTSALVHGGETNYLLATVSLYVSLYNLFLSLLQLLGFASGND